MLARIAIVATLLGSVTASVTAQPTQEAKLLPTDAARSAQCVPTSPAPVQSIQLDAPTTGPTFPVAGRTLVDSLLHDSGDGDYQYSLGYGFPTPNGMGCIPPKYRIPRYVADIVYTVPMDRTGPFSLTHVRTQYRTSGVSGVSANPPRLQFDADAPPRLQVFRGATPPEVQDDSTLAPGAVFNGEIPYTDAVVISPIDGYPVPVLTFVLVPVTSGPVGPELTFQPGEQFTLRIQYFNVPYPQGVEAGYTNGLDGTSLNGLDGTPFDVLRFGGLGQPDSVGPDGISDTWIIRPLSDNAFVSTETSRVREVILGTPSPNPAVGEVHIPFALHASSAARLALYDVTGRLISVVAERVFPAGSHIADLDASGLAAGVYALVLEAGGVHYTRRLSVVR